ncbi:formylglycine-generating enzyme family protein [Streptomyces goshikiensis]
MRQRYIGNSSPIEPSAHAIPPGQVTLSDRRTQRSWSVELAPYQLAATPVTQALYAQITGRRPSTTPGDQLEHACRAGTTGPRYGDLDEIGWYRGNSHEHIHEVGGKRPNSWGLYDMLGNVWDWCWDVYDAEVYGAYRVLRGGGWFDEHWSCRASARRRSHPTFQVDDVGFRVARSIVR